MSFCETVRCGKNSWVNSMPTLKAMAAGISTSVTSAVRRRPAPADSAPIHRKISGMNSSRLATQSAREPIPSLSHGIAANRAAASSHGSARNSSGTKLP